ncbi:MULTISPECIES: CBS domain-containing protein [Catenuloplanes]|uniref:CBS domain-containing protein n=3 Tax=Catenuloplanes TaxID=33874 RepID=A0AAE3ZX50_9ACTN|nr:MULTISPECIES: CBS domain-containing protein [Catenuloplanes]MDP9795577.1 CBS domain-containing protein [Catenuloplanes nepalensis]MDQ0370539.1 CBS domain-containing protein [Catenuloplanes indicus]MDR7326465.1 CBS domain-containing protein [Catenuloplanes niger]
MTTAREIMTTDVTCVGENEYLSAAAKKMADLDVGSLPICGVDNKIKGVITDRDIVVKVLGKGKDPNSITAGTLAQGEAITIGADDDAREILRTMSQHQVRRLPVIDGTSLVGIIALADVARAMSDRPVGDLLEALSQNGR